MIEIYFNYLVYGWIAFAIITFLSLFFIKQPYGRHASDKFGMMIDNKLGWIIMELPSPIVFSIFFFLGKEPHTSMHYVLYALYMIHYINRSIIFPLRTRTNNKKMPLLIALAAIFFNLVNGFVNGWYLGNHAISNEPIILVCLGFLLFIVGFYINNKSDHILLNLRKDGDTGYKIPRGFLFEKITSPNYFGEIIEWTGFCLMNIQIASISFVIWTLANLIPRARDHHQWYLEKFSDYPKQRKRIFPFLY
jgi:protein-S-isoprenylcysteine O-methyltransferase Ste14